MHNGMEWAGHLRRLAALVILSSLKILCRLINIAYNNARCGGSIILLSPPLSQCSFSKCAFPIQNLSQNPYDNHKPCAVLDILSVGKMDLAWRALETPEWTGFVKSSKTYRESGTFHRAGLGCKTRNNGYRWRPKIVMLFVDKPCCNYHPCNLEQGALQIGWSFTQVRFDRSICVKGRPNWKTDRQTDRQTDRLTDCLPK